jgi:hypothetical protein
MGDGQKQDSHDKARDLAEEALGAYASGDRNRGDHLADEAQKIDREAVVEVIRDIDEDAGSDPNAVPQER